MEVHGSSSCPNGTVSHPPISVILIPYSAVHNMDRRMFTRVNLAEKAMNGSLFLFSFPLCLLLSSSSSSSELSHFILLEKVKKVMAGIKTTDGCAMTVLMMSLCQQEAMPSSKPGRNIVVIVAATTGRLCSAGK